MQLIVLSVEQVDSGINTMEAEDLLRKSNELISFFGIASNGEISDRELDTPHWFNGGCDNGIVAEDLLRLVGTGRFA
jgi:hypothetical protein